MVRTVPRSSVAKWPDSGATSSTRGCGGVDVLLEVQQRAERRDMRGLLVHRDLAVADRDAVDAVRRARVGEPGARDQLIGGGQVAQTGVVGDARQRLTERAQRRRRPATRTGTMMSEWA